MAEFQPARLSFWRRAALLPGRARRLFLGVFRRRYIRRRHALREGECLRCGACCQMGVRCPDLFYDAAGLAACRRYDRRYLNCRNFPINVHDLADRDQVAPHQPCGYRFLDAHPESRTL